MMLNTPRFFGPVALFVASGLLSAAAPGGGVLRVEILNVQEAKGVARVSLCTQTQFLKDCAIHGVAPAAKGKTVVTLTGVPPGTYAAQVYADTNGNDKVDRGLFGVPREGVGFSNDAPIRMAPPKWRDAKFVYDGRQKTIRINLRYF